MTDKIYHIYVKNHCIYHSLSESDFKKIWDMIDKFLSITGSVDKEDVTYEELIISKDLIANSSY